MPAVVRPWFRRAARDRWRDALCNGETLLPRRRHQNSALALAALTTAFVHVSSIDDARAQSPGTSPFQPSLIDPRNVQRFKAVDQPPLATARTILPPSGAGETGFDSTGALGKKKKARKKPGEPRPLPPPPPPLPGAPQAAAGHGSAPQVKARARLCRCLQAAGYAAAAAAGAAPGCLRAARHPRRQLSAETRGRGDARSRQQSLAYSERQELGLHDRGADLETAIELGAPRVSRRPARQLLELRLAIRR